MGINLFWNITFVFALTLGCFVAIVLLVQYAKERHLSQLFLGLFALVFSSILLNNFVYWNDAMRDYPQFIYSTVSTPYLIAPLFYLYCTTFLRAKISKKSMLHFLPFVILTLLFAPIIFLSGSEKTALVQAFSEGNYPVWAYYSRHLKWLLSFQLIVYPLWIYYELRTYLITKKDAISSTKQNQLNWLYFFNSLLLLYGVLMFSYYLLVTFETGGIEKDYYISLVLCIAIYSISYIGMSNPDLLKGEKFLQRIVPNKYKNTPLADEYLTKTVQQLEQLMETEQLYLNADLNLQQLCEQTNIPRHHLSQALNQHRGQTFREFINQYRIAYACQQMQTAFANKNIKTIMYESGFNNRASFNNYFKKSQGMTASEYLKKVRSMEKMP
ncbi:MAG: helix-turn-helix domain-containing protein [Saprospiraceae bacterium]